MKEFKNSLNGSNMKIAIAVARFNEVVTDKLLEGAVRELETLGVSSSRTAPSRSLSVTTSLKRATAIATFKLEPLREFLNSFILFSFI